ncbi:hypothetical protein IOU64_004426 [Salmonella enterica]|nr:hypothetical protein [Salmonella enterica]
MKKKKPLRGYDELLPAERMDIIKAFHFDFTGYGFAERYRLTVDAFRRLKRESREHCTR